MRTSRRPASLVLAALFAASVLAAQVPAAQSPPAPAPSPSPAASPAMRAAGYLDAWWHAHRTPAVSVAVADRLAQGEGQFKQFDRSGPFAIAYAPPEQAQSKLKP